MQAQTIAIIIATMDANLKPNVSSTKDTGSELEVGMDNNTIWTAWIHNGEVIMNLHEGKTTRSKVIHTCQYPTVELLCYER